MCQTKGDKKRSFVTLFGLGMNEPIFFFFFGEGDQHKACGGVGRD